MRREHHRWFSPALGREMDLLVFGHAGARVLAFPTSQGRYHDWEDRGMVETLADHVRQGWLQIYCVDTVDAESWYDLQKSPAERAQRHAAYDAYLLTEVVPASTAHNPNPFLITAGASFGAYHALAFALRHPELVNRALGMSGLYDIRRFTDGYSDDTVHAYNPEAFITMEHDPARLEALRRQDIILATGYDDSNCASSERLSAILWDKGIGNALRLWDGWAHDWPWWQQMLRHYIGGHD